MEMEIIYFNVNGNSIPFQLHDRNNLIYLIEANVI